MITPGEILWCAQEIYGVDVGVIISKRREHRQVRARRAAMRLMREVGYSPREIGDVFNCCLNNVNHALRSMRNAFDTDSNERKDFNRARLLSGLEPTETMERISK